MVMLRKAEEEIVILDWKEEETSILRSLDAVMFIKLQLLIVKIKSTSAEMRGV